MINQRQLFLIRREPAYTHLDAIDDAVVIGGVIGRISQIGCVADLDKVERSRGVEGGGCRDGA